MVMATPMERITVNDLKAEFGFTDAQLNKRCTVEHLKKIAPFVQNFTLFANKFEMEPAVLSSIKTNQDWDILQKVEAVLIWWQANMRNATYQSFIEVCIELGKVDLARKICQQLPTTSKKLDIVQCGYILPTESTVL